MSTYYLMQRPGNALDRYVIDEEPIAGYEIVKTCEAGSWVEAKSSFGFELTRNQANTLDFGGDLVIEKRRALTDAERVELQRLLAESLP